jgi:flagellar motor component MotA
VGIPVGYSVVKPFGTTVKKASKKEVEAGLLEMGGMIELKCRHTVGCVGGL